MARLSSDGPAFSTLDPEPTFAQSSSVTQSLNPVIEPVLDQSATSSLSIEPGSVISTDAIPTSSGFVEPAGRSVIFRISVADNQRRNAIKRQAIGGFVGNDNPESCTFAATFNLAEGQLFEGGAPIYYSGESYKELSGLGSPSSGSITKTFVDTGRLVFRNSGLPNGRAGFCQTPDGIVYVTFTNGPTGCIAIELVVYDGRFAIFTLLACSDQVIVIQCQDGRLIGDHETATPSDTIPQDTTTPGETDSTVTSGIKDASTVQVSYSSSDFMTQSESELFGTSPTSDLGASDVTSLGTTRLPASSNSDPASIADTESPAIPEVQLSTESDPTSFSSTTDAPDGTASVPSYHVDITLADSTLTDTILTDTTTIDTTITDTPITVATTTDTAITNTAITDTTSMDVTITDTTTIDIMSLTTSTIGFDITNQDTTDTTTTAASTLTADVSATSSGTPNPICTDTNNPYTASNGVAFTLSCNTFVAASLIQDPYLSDWIPCLQACSAIQACLGILMSRSSPNGFYCYLVSWFQTWYTENIDSWDVAFRDAVIADTTTETTDTTTADSTTADTTTENTTTADTTTADISAGDTTISAAPTETSGLSTCGGLSSPVQVDDDTYDILCSAYRPFADFTRIQTATFLSCIQACSQSNSCVGVVYQEESETCYLSPEFGSRTVEADSLNSAYRREA